VVYLNWIGKRQDVKCWWYGHEYQTQDHSFKWCKRWTQEQKVLWKGIEKKEKQKNQILISLVVAKEECTQALLDFLFYIDVSRVSGVVEKVDSVESVY
jgi:hypothetical protein